MPIVPSKTFFCQRPNYEHNFFHISILFKKLLIFQVGSIWPFKKSQKRQWMIILNTYWRFQIWSWPLVVMYLGCPIHILHARSSVFINKCTLYLLAAYSGSATATSNNATSATNHSSTYGLSIRPRSPKIYSNELWWKASVFGSAKFTNYK